LSVAPAFEPGIRAAGRSWHQAVDGRIKPGRDDRADQ
jgi:hypothetical protein